MRAIAQGRLPRRSRRDWCNIAIGCVELASNHESACPQRTQHLANMSRRRTAVVSYSIESLILWVRQAGLLRNNNNLGKSLSLCSELLGYSHGWITSATAVPSRSTISRHKFTLDAGWCLFRQKRFRHWVNTGKEFWIFLLSDGSPHGGARIHAQCDVCGA